MEHTTNPVRNKWITFILSIVVPFYFIYVLIKLYNTHEFRNGNIIHRRFTWTAPSVVFLFCFIILFIDIILVFILFIHEFNNMQGFINTFSINPNVFGSSFMGSFIILVLLRIIYFIVHIVSVFLLSYMAVKVVYSHDFENGSMIHKKYNEDYIILWFIGLLILPVIVLYIIYRISKVYSYHS